MRKLLLAVMAVVFIGNVNAQNVKFGVKSGINVASINGSEDNADARIGMHIGIVSEIGISDKFSVQPELMFSSQGAKVKGLVPSATVKLDYVAMPIMVKYYIVDGFSVEVGPQFSFLVNDVIDFDNENGSQSDLDTDAENFDLSAAIGLGYKLTSKLFAQARYNVGVTTIEENPDITNGVFQFSVGYQF